VLLGIAIAGMVLLGLGWRGSARTLFVPLQVPWLVSAGIAGLAMTGGALALLDVHLERRRAAMRRQQTDDLVRDGILLVEAWRARRALTGGAPSPRTAARRGPDNRKECR
jgi:hypothetical protein